MSSDLMSAIHSLPKVELHRHLEGAIRPGTIGDICREYGVKLPTYDAAELSKLVQLREPASNLTGFLEPFKLIKSCFVNQDAISRITYEAINDACLDNVQYVEFRFAPEYMAFCHGLSLNEVMDGIVQGVEMASRNFLTVVKLIVSICRDRSPETMGSEWPSAMEIARTAVEYADRGVVGFDLSGIESGFPPELFVEPFRIAREAGLGITVHAGEDAGPESVRGAIEHLGATRIGHGVRIVHDPEVMRLAVDRGVAFEVCPTSNVLTRAVESLDAHPIRRMFDAGLAVTVNTDDPSVCGVTLSDELVLLNERFGFSLSAIEQLMDNARRSAFFKM